MPDAADRFVWYELMTNDMKAAEQFYKDVIGWDAKDAGADANAYTMFSVGETPAAGLMTIPRDAAASGVRPGWIAYIGVDDVDARVARISDAGGRVQRPPQEIPGVGRFAIVTDPQGAAFALFQRGDGGSTQTAENAATGHTGWHELMAADWESAFEFYADQFGWTKVEAVDMGPMGTYQTFGPPGGDAFGGMMTKPDTVPVPNWRYYFTVDGIDAARARVEAGGGRATIEPMEVPGGSWVLNCLDGQGANFSLIAPGR